MVKWDFWKTGNYNSDIGNICSHEAFAGVFQNNAKKYK